MERYDYSDSPETKEPQPDSGKLAPETISRIQKGPDEQPGGLDTPMEGSGEGHVYNDGRGGVVTPEMYEKYRSPENQIEREPYTYRAVPVDPSRAAASMTPADPPAPPSPPSDAPPPPTAGDPPPPPNGPPPLTKDEEELLRQVEQERKWLDEQARQDAAKLGQRPPYEDVNYLHPQAEGGKQAFGEAGRNAMQGVPDTPYDYPPLDPELKLQLSNIQDMPVEQRREAMADLFRREGTKLSRNATAAGDHVLFHDETGFEWLIDYRK